MSAKSKYLRSDGDEAKEPTPPVSSIASVTPLRPALASTPDGCRYLGNLSRSRFYELLPLLDVVKIGARTFVTVDSLDRLIAANRQSGAR
jgi:hypothetical protein